MVRRRVGKGIQGACAPMAERVGLQEQRRLLYGANGANRANGANGNVVGAA